MFVLFLSLFVCLFFFNSGSKSGKSTHENFVVRCPTCNLKPLINGLNTLLYTLKKIPSMKERKRFPVLVK